MVLDVWRNVLMMGGGLCQGRVKGMGLRIVPVQLVAARPYFVAVAFNGQGGGVPTQALVYDQAMAAAEGNLAGPFGKEAAR